jgi:glutathione S-transferase
MLTLYAAAGTCSLATAIALEEAGADYELVKLNFAAGDQRGADFLAKNPKGRVPALMTKHGLLTENVALLAYIALSFPAENLAPKDPFHFAEMQAFNAYLSSTVHVNHAHGRRGARWTDDAAALETMKAKVPQNMAQCYSLIENTMFKGPWVIGEQFTVADAYLYTIDTWLKGDGVELSDFANLFDHFNRMNQRPAVKRALERHG